MIILVPIFFSLYSMNEDINYKYKGFINKVVKIINIEEISKNNDEIKNTLSDNNFFRTMEKYFIQHLNLSMIIKFLEQD